MLCRTWPVVLTSAVARAGLSFWASVIFGPEEDFTYVSTTAPYEYRSTLEA